MAGSLLPAFRWSIWADLSTSTFLSVGFATKPNQPLKRTFPNPSQLKTTRPPGSTTILPTIPDPESMSLDDPLGATYVDIEHRFRLDRYGRTDEIVAARYMRGDLHIPRHGAQYVLEPFVQISTKIETAVRIFMQLDDPEGDYEDMPFLWTGELVPSPARAHGDQCLPAGLVPFECGSFPLEDEVTGAVNWLIPPPSVRDALTWPNINLNWIPDRFRETFEDQYRKQTSGLLFRF